MNKLTNIPTRVVAIATALLFPTMIMMAVIQLTDEPSGETTVVGIEHLSLAGFSAMLLLLVPVVLYLGAVTGRKRFGVAAAVAQIALALVATSSNVRGEDAAFFPPVAIITNLTILVSLVVIGVALRKRLGSPLWIAVGLPLTHIFALPLSSFGGTAVAGAYWLAIGWLAQNDRLTSGFGSPSRRETVATGSAA